MGGLHLIVHDFDGAEMRRRATRLKRTLPDAEVRGFTSRRGLLTFIASLLANPPGGVPVCLIDLQHPDRQDRGEQLLQTIARHPRLAERVALIAFTRFNHPGRAEALERSGARGILSPLQTDDARLEQWLMRVASGHGRVISFGEPPSDEEDVKFLQGMVRLFVGNETLRQPDQAAAFEEAVRVLTLCRLFHDGYGERAIFAIAPGLGYSRPEHIDRVRDQLDRNTAYRIGAVREAGGKLDLGAVIPEIAQFDDRSARRIDHLAVDRRSLDGLGTIKWVQDVWLDRRDPGQDGAWIPPAYLPVLDGFLVMHERVRPIRNPSKTAVAAASTAAIAAVASEIGLTPDEVRDVVVHAIACIENRALDTGTDEPGGNLY